MRLLAAAVLLLGGCTLIDQNTFDPHAKDVPVVQMPKPPVAVPAIPGPPPLVVIGPVETGYAEPLRRAVASARAKRPGVVFDVVEMHRPDAAADATLGTRASEVARVIEDAGIDPARVRLAARPDAAAPPGEVRVFVR